jgi:Rad3-related DNA helicase
VLQAAGRVIRTSEDIGVVALLDDRFLQATYRALFPREWRGYKTVLSDSVNNEISRFWSGFKDNLDGKNEAKS